MKGVFGNTVMLTLRNNIHSATWHSIDLHAVYGPGGAADVLTVLPGKGVMAEIEIIGKENPEVFKAESSLPSTT